MQVIIGVRFKKLGKVYYFDPKDTDLQKGEYVIVETSKGIEYGEVVINPKTVKASEMAHPVKSVIRKATEEDFKKANENKHKECKARKICSKKIADHNLAMKVVKVEYSFDASKAVFYFTAEGRIDFRDLVKELAVVLKTRIELRQIGVRDEAKVVGGLGPCGRQMCCAAFLGDFDSVSIKMAKEQCLSLNPAKISGVCGRLMCCLKYEQPCYEEIRNRMPKLNREVLTPKGKGIVIEVNVLGEKLKVKLQQEDGSSAIEEFPLNKVRALKNYTNGSQEQDENIESNEEIEILLDR